jgi:uncharacterized protein
MTTHAITPDAADPRGLVSSTLDPAEAMIDRVVQAGDGFLEMVPSGGSIRIVDLEGNQAADTLFYDAADLTNRYSAFDTIREQAAVYLTAGARLLSQRLDLLGTITADTCGRHDTIGGACSQESNVIRYGEHTRHQHACRQTFIAYGAAIGIGAAEIAHNINCRSKTGSAPRGPMSRSKPPATSMRSSATARSSITPATAGIPLPSAS